jgi:hypothetical protein
MIDKAGGRSMPSNARSRRWNIAAYGTAALLLASNHAGAQPQPGEASIVYACSSMDLNDINVEVTPDGRLLRRRHGFQPPPVETMAEGRRTDYLRWSAMLDSVGFERLESRRRRGPPPPDARSCRLKRGGHEIAVDDAPALPPVLLELIGELRRTMRELSARPAR